MFKYYIFGQYQNTCLFFQIFHVTQAREWACLLACSTLAKHQLSISYYEGVHNMFKWLKLISVVHQILWHPCIFKNWTRINRGKSFQIIFNSWKESLRILYIHIQFYFLPFKNWYKDSNFLHKSFMFCMPQEKLTLSKKYPFLKPKMQSNTWLADTFGIQTR